MGENLLTFLFDLFFSFCSIVTHNVHRRVFREQIICRVMLPCILGCWYRQCAYIWKSTCIYILSISFFHPNKIFNSQYSFALSIHTNAAYWCIQQKCYALLCSCWYWWYAIKLTVFLVHSAPICIYIQMLSINIFMLPIMVNNIR